MGLEATLSSLLRLRIIYRYLSGIFFVVDLKNWILLDQQSTSLCDHVILSPCKCTELLTVIREHFTDLLMHLQLLYSNSISLPATSGEIILNTSGVARTQSRHY